jgi:hypothetical protein
MKKINLVLAFLLLYFTSFGQVEINTEWDNDGNLTFFSQNMTNIPHSIMLDFPKLQNLSSTGGRFVTAVALPGRSKLTTLRITKQGIPVDYSYSYRLIKGNVFGKSKTEPIYVVPVQEGTKVNVDFLTPLESVLGQEVKGSAYRGVIFKFEEEAMIVAPRKGIVSEIKMDAKNQSNNINFTEVENTIELYHEDGTLTRIQVLKTNSQQVKLGQIVFPGDVLAASAGENYNSGRHVRMICLKPERENPDSLFYTNIPVIFATPTGSHKFSNPESFEVVFPEEIRVLELNKKELKAFQERK